MALPVRKDSNETGAVSGRGNVYPRRSETFNYPGIGDEVRTDALDAENGFTPAQGGRQDQLIGEMLFQGRA